ncbi:MAG: CubicO group peptidase (beta-lactamase class C family) [Cellvibrionaceae bacterium]|jgi:CubicO group peptidase (beta-lactamase class C family)
MKLTIKIIIVTLLMLIWVSIAFYGGLSGWWLKPLAKPNDTDGFFNSAVQLIEGDNRGNVAFALLENGKVVKQHFLGVERELNVDTLFATASMSKWVTAYAVMRLVERGQLDLDRPISIYLNRWNLPKGEFDNSQVTVRQLLSHTSGLADGLGFGDFLPDESLPTLVDSLNNPKASDGKQVSIALGSPPGSEWQYSGGGYLILQLIIEEVSGQSFKEFVQRSVFDTLEMTRSNYEYLQDYSNKSNSYDKNGNLAIMYKYEASAATGLSSSLADLENFVLANVRGNAFDKQIRMQYISDMRVPHGNKLGADIWGLGVMLYAQTDSGDYVFGHDGANSPAINTSVRVNPDNSDAVIVLVSGNTSLATRIGSEWTLWQTGQPDFLSFEIALKSAILPALIGVIVLIILFSAWLLLKRR